MVKTYLLHVKEGYDDRLRHMQSLLSSHGIDYELVLDGDIDDLSDAVVDEYFIDYMHEKVARTSCAYKHILCWCKIVEENIDYALVLEDDMFFSKKFDDVFQKTLQERVGDLSPWYVGFEATCLKLVPRSQRKRGVVIYPGDYVQCTGAYLINRAAAQAILEALKCRKCNLPIDGYLNDLQLSEVFKLYWTYPPIAEQGSHNGKMESIIGNHHKKSFFRVVARKLTVLYKRVLYFFR